MNLPDVQALNFCSPDVLYGHCQVSVSVRPVADPQTYGKLTLNVELAGAARLHRAASVLMDGLELSGAHI